MSDVRICDWLYDEDEKIAYYEKTTTDNLIRVANSNFYSEHYTAMKVLEARKPDIILKLAKKQLDGDGGDVVFKAEMLEFVFKYDNAYAVKFLDENPNVREVYSEVYK